MVNGQFHNYSTTDGLSSNRVVSVYQDRHGTIWAGTSRGINRMIGDRFAPALSPNQIFDPRYISFAEDSSGDLYALSAPKGVDRIEGNQLVEVNHDLDLLSMVTSPSGESWFTGGNGIFRFSAEAFRQNQAGSETPLDYAWFGKADGMTSTQCSIGAPNMALAPDGKLWVATVQGLAMLDLQHLSFDAAKPRVFVDDVTGDRDLVQWVRKKAPTCRRVCSVCVGSFLLAAAGVLDGRRVATHWMYAPLLATRYPQVAVEPDALFVHDGRVWSSAGVTTGIDLALALIEEDAGRQVAMNVARMLVVYLKRAGGQSQYSALLAAQVQSESETFDSLDRWIAEHLNDDLRVGALAEQVHMSPRNFARAYAEKRGRTPAKAVEAIRVEAARRRLEETEDRIESVAEDSGFSNEEQMRCSFIRILGIPPREYRKRFS